LVVAKSGRRLHAEVKEASDIALLAMETSSFLGEVIKFLEFSFACKTFDELFEAIQHCISRMNLCCSAVMDADGSSRYFGDQDQRQNMDLLQKQRENNRIWDHGDLTLFTYPELALMVYPMPVCEVDRYGQLKDVLVMLANGANARVHGINTEHKALKAHETKSAFLAKMSHELRTPLNAIIGFSRLLQRKKITETYSQRDLDAISAVNSNGYHLLNMVTDLLDFAQLDVGGLTLAKSHCDIVPILSKVVEGYRFWADEKKLDLYPVTAENGLIAVVDPARIEQVFRNIVANAIKFTHHGFIQPQVRKVSDVRLGDCFAVVVHDSGEGVSDENYRQLVQIFSRPNMAAVRSLDGVGMGLSMAAALV
ncbi:MAG TPA: histidine kinase dimerization/phospho-acceptor domain-containing protein, partial [Pseudomonadales bacterium]|nr:histidine kinase dimerization/phospho-acceptor domain-containing protein [Pseudomonadales bacterium]